MAPAFTTPRCRTTEGRQLTAYNLIPAAYADYAGRYFKSMQEYPTAYTSAEDVAEAVYAAATDGRDKLRHPAGADSVMLAELRQSLPEQEFITRMRTMFGGVPTE